MKRIYSKLNQRKWFKNDLIKIEYITSCVMIIVISYVFINASRWSYYFADDFSHANTIGVFLGEENIVELFKAAVSFTIHMYKTWQGTYFSMFLQGFLSPLNGYGEVQLAIVMVCNIILFELALILLISEVCKLFGIERHIKAFISFLALLSVLGFKAWTEIFYWFSGAVSYSFPLSVAMIAMVLYIKNRNMFTYVAACILAFLASGGSLEVAGTSCFGILIVLFVKGFSKLKKKDYIFFGIAVLGAMINTFAPGNFERRDVIDNTGLHLGEAFIYSVNQVICSIEYLLYQTPFLIVVILCVMIGVYVGESEEENGKRMWFNKIFVFKIIGMCAIMPVVTCFPVYLAYASPNGANFPNRCEFICILVITLVFMIMSILLGEFLKETRYIKNYKKLLVALIFLFLIMPMLNESYKYSSTVIYRMYNNLAMDKFKKYHDSIMDIYRGIEESESQNVVIENLPVAVDDFMDINSALSVDSIHWANEAIAKYYGKDSVALRQYE